MAGTVAQYPVGTYTTPVEGGSLDASVVVSNDNTTGAKHNSHDADPTIHVQSSALAARPSAGTAQRFWVTTDGLRAYFDFSGAWNELQYLPLAGGTMTGTAALAGATFTTSIISTTALATPSALAATQFTAFASTVSGATLMGFGTTNDVSLKNRAGTTVLGIGPNTTVVNVAGSLTSTGAITTTNGALGVDVDTPTTAGLATFTNRSVTIPSGLTSVRAAGANVIIGTQMGAASETSRLFLLTSANGQTTVAPRIVFTANEGSFASPAATANAATLGAIEFQGFGNAFTTQGGAQIAATATQLWTATANGTKLGFNVTANGTTTQTSALLLDQDSSATFYGAVSGITTLAASGVVTLSSSAANPVVVNGATTGASYAAFQNTSGNCFVGVNASATIISNGTAYSTFFGSNNGRSTEFIANGNAYLGISGANGTPANISAGNLYILNTSAPTGNPTGMLYVWAESGAGKARGTSGTVTTWAPAEPHCPVCGSDFGHEWHNDKYGGTLRVCMKCLTDELGERPWIQRLPN